MDDTGRIIGLDGQPMKQGNGEVGPEPQILSDEAAEALGTETTDISAVDDLGVPFFYPMDHQKEELRGKRIPPQERRHYRKVVKDRLKHERARLAQPVRARDLESMFQEVILPMQRQVRSLGITVMALKSIMLSKGLMTEPELNVLMQMEMQGLREAALKKVAVAQGWSPEQLSEQIDNMRRQVSEQMKAAASPDTTTPEGAPTDGG